MKGRRDGWGLEPMGSREDGAFKREEHTDGVGCLRQIKG